MIESCMKTAILSECCQKGNNGDTLIIKEGACMKDEYGLLKTLERFYFGLKAPVIKTHWATGCASPATPFVNSYNVRNPAVPQLVEIK